MNDALVVNLCTIEDIGILASLNKQLIEDEQHDNPMNAEQLKARMGVFISSEYNAYLFNEQGVVKGYALVKHARQPLYLRQFFICRESRRQGLGKVAFAKLLDYLGTDTIDLEVMFWNERGKQFWRSLGFQERSLYLRREQGVIEPERKGLHEDS
ncbi:GNAT family N-acetyltransferase [Paenibacillus albus]|uniref:GNAT family N-acetyltransferase n=1 Tax=Paenibacillus albus TaxID=2495582 RepID=A0A3Q8X665_9BACL|nr:GNAT family N-acetyltransferase [Paenibacillus albus]AZN40981.1 GNAT family N-acetyltransferase [Paenibacillus albus]